MNSIKEICKVVRYHRKKAGLSQQELARLAGVGKTAVFDIEKGKESIQLDTLWKILRILNISVRFDSPLMDKYTRENLSETS